MAFIELRYSAVEDFIEPITTTIDLNMMEFNNFYIGKESNPDFRELKRTVIRKYNDIVSLLDDGLGFRFNLGRLYNISYTPHRDKYDFRLNPIVFINNLFKGLGLNNEIPFIDLDDRYGLSCFDEFVYRNIKDILDNTEDEYVIYILENLVDNLKIVNELYYVDINSLIEETAIPKDILFTLAYKSLNDFIDTNNEVYKIFAYNYYHRISHMKNTAYPHTLRTINSNYIWYDGYRQLYRDYIGEDYVPNVDKYKLNNRNVVIGMDILRPGSIDKELTDIVHRVRSESNVDYDKFINLFEKKINFYKHSPYVNTVIGKYGLNGYMGFTYENEYLVFDKFYNSDTINPARRTILTHGEAIYALPSDRFGIIAKTKQDIIEEKEIDTRIKKLNHNETFIKRIEPIIYGPNVSTSTFEEEIEKYKTKMLINRV